MKKEKKMMDEYEVKCAADTLIRAEEIKADKKMAPLVKKELRKREKALDNLKKRIPFSKGKKK